MRKLTTSEIGAVGVLVLIVVIIINAILIGVGNLVIVDESSSYTGLYGVHMTPQNYSDLTDQERFDWLADQHGGVKERYTRYFWTPPFFEGRVLFNDGYDLSDSEIADFTMGTVNDFSIFDTGQILIGFFTFNPPILSYIGVVGYVIRVIFIGSIIIAVVEMLPFFG